MSVQVIPRSTPTEQGVDSAGILAFLDAIEQAEDIEPHSLMVLRHGSVVAEGWWAPYTADRVHLLYSLSKSFTSTAAAIASHEGLLRLDDTVISYFPELDTGITDPGSRAMLVRHVASMASGHLTDTADRVFAEDPAEPVRAFLTIPPDRAPGTVFAYNQLCTYSLAAIVQRRSGQTLVDYLRPRLFDPLGIGAVGWEEHPPGRNIGYSGLHARTEDIASLGQLYLQRGRWADRQLLPPEWVDEATRVQVANPDEVNPDWHQGYGFQFWMARHGYRGDGAFGQFCIVLPEQDVVIAITSATENMQGVLDAVWKHLLPAFGDGTSTSTGTSTGDRLGDRDGDLRTRLAQLALPAQAGPPLDEADRAWRGATFTHDSRSSDLPSLRKVTVVPGDAGWQVTLEESQSRLDLHAAATGWTVGDAASQILGRAAACVPVAATGRWTGPGRLQLDVVFLETPHRLVLTCSPTDGTFAARWNFRPLGDRQLTQMHSPHRG